MKPIFLYLQLILLSVFYCNLAIGQTNNPGPYCVGSYSYVPCSGPGPSNASGNTVNDFIDSLYTTGANANLSTVSPGCNGFPNNYIYYCNQHLVCSPGQTIQLNLKSGNPYQQAFVLFIDWDQNSQFDLPSEFINYPNTPVSIGTWTNLVFVVPLNAAPGIYRMRIRSFWGVAGLNASPCGNWSWGETEDYNILIGTPPPISLTTATASSNYSVCSGQSATFQLQYSGVTPLNFSWIGPAGFSQSAQNFSIQPVASAHSGYYHCSMGTSTCPLLASTYLWVQSTPSIQLSASSNTICPGTIVQLSCSGYSAITWYPGASNNASFVITPSSNIIYTVVAQPSYNCPNSQTIGITVKSIYTVQVSASSTLVCSGEFINLQASGAEFYSWSFAQGGPSVTYQAFTSTLVSVIGSGSLCNASASISISVDNCETVEENGETEFQLLYTNPFSDHLILNSSIPVEIAIYSLQGKKLLSLPADTHFRIPTLDFSSGMYLLRCFSGKNHKAIKVIKD